MNDSLFEARVRDAVTICERSASPRFLGFLTQSEAAAAQQLLLKLRAKFKFFGGYEDAERRFLCCCPEWCDEPQFPICAYTLSFRECDSLSHRDFLGALMALGIERSCVGDILVQPGRAVIFLSSDISGYVISQLQKVGNVGVDVAEGFLLPLPGAGERVECSDTVASMRLDCVVGAVCGVSRKVACEMIEQGIVSLNSFVCQKSTKAVASGDRLTVRGKGRFDLISSDGFSKKGRIILKYYKFK